MHLTQPGLSRQLRQLERDLGRPDGDDQHGGRDEPGEGGGEHAPTLRAVSARLQLIILTMD
ncbi:helix-turn-helix domain-containing protein [Actinoplanes philippinensis]|uniref:helix-turn-helix domain-containing protein n=1 Tax=Actinoplanes philippinensis TaxID=35752 RepID=UPI0033DF9830